MNAAFIPRKRYVSAGLVVGQNGFNGSVLCVVFDIGGRNAFFCRVYVSTDPSLQTDLPVFADVNLRVTFICVMGRRRAEAVRVDRRRTVIVVVDRGAGALIAQVKVGVRYFRVADLRFKCVAFGIEAF